jgi:Domain of unknown function (DUF4926)
MILEYDVVTLTVDLPDHGLKRGDRGAVVMVYGNGVAFEVEFVAPDGTTLALLTLNSEQISPDPPGRP